MVLADFHVVQLSTKIQGVLAAIEKYKYFSIAASPPWIVVISSVVTCLTATCWASAQQPYDPTRSASLLLD